jgi:hypothetical protein
VTHWPKKPLYRKEVDVFVIPSIILSSACAVFSAFTSNRWGFLYAGLLILTLALPRNRAALKTYWNRASRWRYTQVRVKFDNGSKPISETGQVLQMVYRREMAVYEMLSRTIHQCYPEIEYLELAPDTEAVNDLLVGDNPAFRATLWFQTPSRAIEFKLKYGDEIVFS